MTKPRTSTRDPESLLESFAEWLGHEVDATTPPTIVSHGGPAGAGLSSDTLLLDVTIDRDDEPVTRPVVLRLPPPDDAFPIFEHYDLARQVESMRVVRAGCDAPVPEILWAETTGDAIGVPFFVMERVDGLVPPDILPYTWGSWVTELDHAQLASMTSDAVDSLVAIHSVAPTDTLIDAERSSASGAKSLERHLARMRRHFEWARRDRDFPTIERAFIALEGSIPRIDRPDVLLWGDARIGNILWREARAVAILDWEMTTVGPCELDVAWMAYFAMTFQRSAEARGHPGVPSLLRLEDVIRNYESATGVALRSFDWFLALTGLHQSIIGIRTSDRSIAFGEWPEPDHPEAPIHSIPTLTALLDALDHA